MTGKGKLNPELLLWSEWTSWDLDSLVYMLTNITLTIHNVMSPGHSFLRRYCSSYLDEPLKPTLLKTKRISCIYLSMSWVLHRNLSRYTDIYPRNAVVQECMFLIALKCCLSTAVVDLFNYQFICRHKYEVCFKGSSMDDPAHIYLRKARGRCIPMRTLILVGLTIINGSPEHVPHPSFQDPNVSIWVKNSQVGRKNRKQRKNKTPNSISKNPRLH